MPMDFEVFEPADEHIAQIIVRILEEKGYNAGYQLGYPHNKILIKVDTKEEADRVSSVVRGYMKKFHFNESGITASRLNILTNKLGSLIPEMPNVNQEILSGIIEKRPEKDCVVQSEALESRVNYYAKVEELRRKIDDRLRVVNVQISENPKDRLNDKRRVERDTLIWVLQNMS
jgi:hypothetical protein